MHGAARVPAAATPAPPVVPAPPAPTKITHLPLVPSYYVDEIIEGIPENRNDVWEYADSVVRDWGERGDTEDREDLWEAIVAYRNPKWVVGLSERYRLLRRDGIDPMRF